VAEEEAREARKCGLSPLSVIEAAGWIKIVGEEGLFVRRTEELIIPV
jgi:hypothetical protein